MKLFDYFADKLIERARKTPYFHLPGYMERFWLIPYNRFNVAARVHHILRSDDDRAFHDHPWPYITIILRGGYTEVTPIWDKSGIYKGIKRKYHKAGSILFRGAKTWHRLEVTKERTAWTLFITFKKKQSWGFLPEPDMKVHYKKYLGEDQ